MRTQRNEDSPAARSARPRLQWALVWAAMAAWGLSSACAARQDTEGVGEAERARRAGVALDILRAQDLRRFDEAKLDAARKDSHAALREMAALALGRIGDERARPWLETGLEDSSAEVRTASAFSLGLLADASSTDALIARFATETGDSVKVALLRALALCIVGEKKLPEAAQTFVDELLASEHTRHIASMLTSLGVAARQRSAQLPEALARPIAELAIRHNAPEVRRGAVYALWRGDRVRSVVAYLNRALKDRDADVRRIAVKALGSQESAEGMDTVALMSLAGDQDRWVRLEVLRAATSLKPGGVDSVLQGRLALVGQALFRAAAASGDKRRQATAKQEAAEGLHALRLLSEAIAVNNATAAALTGQAIWEKAGAWLKDPDTGRLPLRSEVGHASCYMALAMDVIDGKLDKLPKCGGGAVSEQRRRLMMADWAALTRSPEPKRLGVLRGLLAGDDAAVRVAAVDAVARLKSPVSRRLLATMLGHGDRFVAAAAADALVQARVKDLTQHLIGAVKRIESPVEARLTVLQALAQDVERHPEAVAPLRGKLRETVTALLKDPDYAVAKAAARALSLAFGKAVRPQSAKGRSLVNEALARDILEGPRRVRATLETSRGAVELELLTRRAPITARRFLALARKGFYENLSFHRVVPGFVVQGGDPRGDGWGGPGYTLRCELNSEPYSRGAVGMALAGRDTGGSQFFVTQTAQPHLEGAYTVFGRVVKGMDVIDALQPGDRILAVRSGEAGAASGTGR